MKTDINDKFIIPSVDYKLDNSKIKKCDINFIKKKMVPHGICTNSLHKINNKIYSFGGFSAGEDSINGLSFFSTKLIGNHQKKYYNDLLVYSIEDDNWDNLGIIDEIIPRGNHQSTTYNNNIYIFGGFHFEFMDLNDLTEYKNKYGYWPQKKEQRVLKDAYKIIIKSDNTFEVVRIKNLPLPLYNGKTILINNKLYFFSGATNLSENMDIYDNELLEKISSEFKIDKSLINSGNILFSLDLDNPIEYKFESFFPGIPLCSTTLLNINDNIYIIGGITKKHNINHPGRNNYKIDVGVDDIWIYSPIQKKWEYLTKIPISGVSGIGCHKYGDYIIFFGGAKQFCNASITNGKITEVKNTEHLDILRPHFKYGNISNIISLFNEKNFKNNISYETCGQYDYYQHYFSDLILLYDTKCNNFFLSNKTLPVNINGFTNNISDGNKIYFIGGEINDTLINNDFYGIQSCLVFTMEINSIK